MWAISYYPIFRNNNNNKKKKKNKKIEEPFWKRRIESNINELRKDVSLVERWETGMW